MIKPPQTKFQEITQPDENGWMHPSAVFACAACGGSDWSFHLFHHPDDPKPSLRKSCAWWACRHERGKWMTTEDADALRDKSGRNDC